jgi:hypothetical protein
MLWGFKEIFCMMAFHALIAGELNGGAAVHSSENEKGFLWSSPVKTPVSQ